MVQNSKADSLQTDSAEAGISDNRLMNVKEVRASFDRTLVLDLMRLADDSEPQIRSYIETGRLFLLGSGDLNHVPVGQLLLCQSVQGVPEIRSVSIRPESQRKGLGTFLLNEVIAILRRERMTGVVVSTSTADLDAIRFYQRNGFRFLRVERDAFNVNNGYREHLVSGGILVRDRIWLELQF